MNPIDQLSRIIYTQNPDRQPWDGDAFTYDKALSRHEHRVLLSIKQAKAILDTPGVKIIFPPSS
jgi:hypothetical protein